MRHMNPIFVLNFRVTPSSLDIFLLSFMEYLKQYILHDFIDLDKKYRA